jgi:medium-chain acyl-[acyl-carrier-protein] hydrolase
VQFKATPLAIFAYLEETATCHSETVGMGIDRLSKAARGWVVYRYTLEMQRYPRWQEKITVTTWIERFQRCFAYRNFHIYDENNNLLGRVAAQWVYLDLDLKKPLRIPSQLAGAYTTLNRTAVPEAFQQLPVVDNPLASCEFTVSAADIDLNNHVNHKRYIHWLLATLPLETYLNFFPAKIEITYKKDALYGNHILSQSQQIPDAGNENCYLHRISCPTRGLELALARTTWQKHRTKKCNA